MTTNHHTPWTDNVTEYKASDMNAPLSQLDTAITGLSGEHPHQADKFHVLNLETSPADNDEVPLYDIGSGSYKRITRGDFLSGIGALSGEYPYDIGLTYIGSPGNEATILRYPMPRAVQLNCVSGEACQGVAGTAASGQSVFSIKKNGSQFATATFAAAGTVAGFSGEAMDFAEGDVLTLVAPSSADATLADLGFSLVGTRS